MNSVKIQAVVSSQTKEDIQEMAKQEGITASAFLKQIVEEKLAEEKRKQGVKQNLWEKLKEVQEKHPLTRQDIKQIKESNVRS